MTCARVRHFSVRLCPTLEENALPCAAVIHFDAVLLFNNSFESTKISEKEPMWSVRVLQKITSTSANVENCTLRITFEL